MKREDVFVGAVLALGLGINAIPLIARRIASATRLAMPLAEENAAYLDFTIAPVAAQGEFSNITPTLSWIPGTRFQEGQLIGGTYRNIGPVGMNFMARILEQGTDAFITSESAQIYLAPGESHTFWLPPNYPLGDYPVMPNKIWNLRLELRAYY